MSDFCSTFAPQKFKTTKLTIMEAALQQNYQASRYHSIDEFADNIREHGKLIDPDWRLQPMRPWSEVYNQLCSEVGHVYGLNDIREA